MKWGLKTPGFIAFWQNSFSRGNEPVFWSTTIIANCATTIKATWNYQFLGMSVKIFCKNREVSFFHSNPSRGLTCVEKIYINFLLEFF